MENNILQTLATKISTSDAVQDAVVNLANALNEEAKKEEKETTSRPINSYYVENVPFLVELKFEHWTPEIEARLMDCFMHDKELLEGLKINKLYKATLHSDSLYLDKICDELESIKNLCDGYRSEIDKVMRNIVLESRIDK